jgi:peptidoglycan-associated lipoprotein
LYSQGFHTEDEVKESYRKFMLVAALAILIVTGCAKKTAKTPPPPPPPPPPAPTASLSANPDSVQAGQSTQLTWRTENATDVTLEGVGKVDANGSRTVTPDSSTTYRLVAKGPGGTQESTARVTVAPAPAPVAATASEEQLFAQSVKDVFFDYDSFDLRPDAQQQIAANAAFLKQHPNLRFTVEGHCDERGSTEYNLALGDSRAAAVKEALARAGVPANSIGTISYGKEKPFCTQSTEDCWQQNRRGHFVLQR